MYLGSMRAAQHTMVSQDRLQRSAKTHRVRTTANGARSELACRKNASTQRSSTFYSLGGGSRRNLSKKWELHQAQDASWRAQHRRLRLSRTSPLDPSCFMITSASEFKPRHSMHARLIICSHLAAERQIRR